jgi:hypothetical protein
MSPTAPVSSERAIIVGSAAVTVKLVVLLGTPLTKTWIVPVVAVGGTWAMIEVLFHPRIAAGVPLKLTDPCVVPKSLPDIATIVPMGPEPGNTDDTAGVAASTVRDVLAETLP